VDAATVKSKFLNKEKTKCQYPDKVVVNHRSQQRDWGKHRDASLKHGAKVVLGAGVLTGSTHWSRRSRRRRKGHRFATDVTKRAKLSLIIGAVDGSAAVDVLLINQVLCPSRRSRP